MKGEQACQYFGNERDPMEEVRENNGTHVSKQIPAEEAEYVILGALGMRHLPESALLE